jgi:hypothetical protein
LARTHFDAKGKILRWKFIGINYLFENTFLLIVEFIQIHLTKTTAGMKLLVDVSFYSSEFFTLP